MIEIRQWRLTLGKPNGASKRGEFADYTAGPISPRPGTATPPRGQVDGSIGHPALSFKRMDKTVKVSPVCKIG
jgi:hypothetical protein